MNNNAPDKKFVFIVITATEKTALLVLLKKKSIDTSLLTRTTNQYIN